MRLCPTPAARPLGRAAGFPQPVCPGCGRCGRGDPALAPQRAPLRAGVARRGVGGRGAVCRCEGWLGQALPLPGLPTLWAGCRGLLPTCCGRACAGMAALLPPLWPACPVGGCARRGWRGASGFRRSLFPAACPLGGLPGPAGHVPWARVWVCAVCVASVRCVSWCVVPPFSCPSGAPPSGALVRCCARCVPCACRAPFPARVPCSAAGSPLFLSWLRCFLPVPLLALLPGMHFFPASALVCVSVSVSVSVFVFLSPCAL